MFLSNTICQCLRRQWTSVCQPKHSCKSALVAGWVPRVSRIETVILEQWRSPIVSAHSELFSYWTRLLSFKMHKRDHQQYANSARVSPNIPCPQHILMCTAYRSSPSHRHCPVIRGYNSNRAVYNYEHVMFKMLDGQARGCDTSTP